MHRLNVTQTELAKLCFRKARELEQVLNQEQANIDATTREMIVEHAATLRAVTRLMSNEQPLHEIVLMLHEAEQTLQSLETR